MRGIFSAPTVLLKLIPCPEMNNRVGEGYGKSLSSLAEIFARIPFVLSLAIDKPFPFLIYSNQTRGNRIRLLWEVI